MATVKRRVYSDGKVKWTETLDPSGKPIKIEKSPAPKSFFENTRKHLSKLEVTLKPKEKLDNADHAVMTLAHKALGLTTTVWFNEQTGLESKKVVTDDTGSTTWVVTSIKLNADLRPDQFNYTPPAGVPVVNTGG